MREFILLALKAWTSPDFDINNLPKSGRLDLVCRTISNALWIANDLRRDTVIHAALNGPRLPPKIISFYGETLKGVEPDERSIAFCIKNALRSGMRLGLNECTEVSPGITVAKKAFETLLKESGHVFYLHPKGMDLRKLSIDENMTFVLGDFKGLPRKTEKLIERLGAEKVSLGPKKLFASHCPIIVHNELDRLGSSNKADRKI